jgi:hypothetical protein
LPSSNERGRSMQWLRHQKRQKEHQTLRL